jgi:hypothetical protein
LQEEDGVVEGHETAGTEEVAEWGEAVTAYLRGPAVGAEGVRAAAVGFERSVYIPPYETEVRERINCFCFSVVLLLIN